MSKDLKKSAEVSEKSEDKVQFTDWFSVRLPKHPKLRAHHHGVILAFFKNNGLSEAEPISAFDSMLKTFGF